MNNDVGPPQGPDGAATQPPGAYTDPSRPPPVPEQSSRPGGMGRALGPIGGALLLLFGLAGKLKVILIPALKFFPILLKTGGTMIISIWFYAMNWGVWFAVGFVLLIFVHECGHLVVARSFGLKVGAPVFIPFMGAFIALKDAPRNAWMEAWVGIGGPMLGSLGAVLCEGIFLVTGEPMFRALAYTGFFLNLFNLAPIGMLDGGRIVTALSPWLWIVGLIIIGGLIYTHPNFILFLILLLSLPRIFSLFRKQTEEEKRFYELTASQRLTMAFLYFGLVAGLVLGMHFTHIAPPSASM